MYFWRLSKVKACTENVKIYYRKFKGYFYGRISGQFNSKLETQNRTEENYIFSDNFPAVLFKFFFSYGWRLTTICISDLVRRQ
jgi:hypothetical protein